MLRSYVFFPFQGLVVREDLVMDHRIKVSTHLMCKHFESIRGKNI